MSEWDIVEIKTEIFDWGTQLGILVEFRNGLRHAVRMPMPIPAGGFTARLSAATTALEGWAEKQKSLVNLTRLPTAPAW